ncbi:tetratricopeptide repeat protein [Candidatus Symbiopectobacterium sp. NZEC127]|uniref:tetratricopeptide repeat protein n=1 Tax=Candidatus Symbiopectobacterium sp. NZEC127 TaxID=2820472 RepID=UPI002227D351|nr:tetratricopeptide repeat protein [Candidatus Symbiopectobacterium sp. NZEC127]MCW2488707.1 tetratricopeptide repeat protein [Candidatus Symbiopectobacterium sp. NZEC127]
MGKLVNILLLLSGLLLGGCVTKAGDHDAIDEEQKEFILTKMNDFQGLIKLYREKLNRKEDAKTRYILANHYHSAMDYESSRHYLAPLLVDNPDEDILLLEGKNLLEQGQIAQALGCVRAALSKNPEHGEALNTQGVLLAQQGDYLAAKASFDKARTHFVDEDKVINNLAMLAIMQEDYPTARDYLAPLYARGYTGENLLHNLVFVLVKMRDFEGAEAVLHRAKNVDVSDGLLESLSKIKPRSQLQLQQRELLAKQEVLIKKGQGDEDATPALPLSKEHNNEIIAVRAGQHEKYFRMAMASRERIAIKQLGDRALNQVVYELQGVTASDDILRIGNSLMVDGNVRSISIAHKDNNTILVKFILKKKLDKLKVFHLAAEKSEPERLVFDFYHG